MLYHVAAQTTAREELSRFSRRLASFFQDSLPELQPFTTWEALLEYLGAKARQKAFGILLDEFSYAVEGDRSLPSHLQSAWDNSFGRTGVKMVLCGSSISMMENVGLLPSSPLYGRRTGQWKLEPLSPEAVALLWPARNLAEAIEAYGIVGGSPLYITRFEKRRSLLENVRDQVLTKGAMLYDEVPFLLREEVREARVYQSILSALASGARKFSELSSKTGLDRSHLTRYLATLSDIDLVDREVPVTEIRPEKSRKGLYGIKDPFVAFWYRYVHPNRDRLEGGEAQAILDEVVKPTLDPYLSTRIESIVGLLFRTRWKRFVPFTPAHAGRHWSEQEELDWVILDSSRRKALVVEVKWSAKNVNGRLVMRDLREKAGKVRALQGCSLWFVVVARSGFADSPLSRGDERFIDLKREKLR